MTQEQIGAWSETCLVSIEPAGYGALRFQAITETVDLDIGGKDVEWIPLLNGARVCKYIPQEDSTITLELYPLYAGTATWPAAGTSKAATGVFDIMDGIQDTSEPVGVTFDHTRLPIRLSVLWTDDTTAVNAAGAVAVSQAAIRMAFADGFLTSIKPSFTDGILKMTVTCKFPAFNNDNTACAEFESMTSAASTTMAALTTYTAAGQAVLF